MITTTLFAPIPPRRPVKDELSGNSSFRSFIASGYFPGILSFFKTANRSSPGAFRQSQVPALRFAPHWGHNPLQVSRQRTFMGI